MGRPPKENYLMLVHKYLAKHWDVLSDSLLCGMTVSAISRKRCMSTDAVRIVLRDAWALGITDGDVRKYMRCG